MPEIREPIKTTSIEKKQKIIDAGLKLFSEKGYYKTNTAKIAKAAGVSTGIVYQYFNDKKDILIYAVKLYFEEIYKPIEELFKSIKKPIDLDSFLTDLINVSLKAHSEHSLAHEEMVAMSHSDEDVHNLFIECEHKIIDSLLVFLQENDINTPHMHDKVHMAYSTLENLCHEYIFHKHSFIDYDYTINVTKEIIKMLLIK